MNSFADKNIVVMGLGRFGGGLSVTRWLVDSGSRVTLSDSSDRESLQSSITQLEMLCAEDRLNIVLGPHDTALLNNADLLVVNPAVPKPWQNEFIEYALSKQIQVTTEIEIALSKIDTDRIIAVTGSAGKSTTSAMIHHVLQSNGHDAILAGNIGGSLLNSLDQINPQTIVVLELSSAMLHWLWQEKTTNTFEARLPQIACVTNFMPNHLDWHGDLDHYQDSKQRILQSLTKNSIAILGESVCDWKSVVPNDVRCVVSNASIEGCSVLGKHNETNAAMAVEAVAAMLDSDQRELLIDAVKSFAGLSHRLNHCHRVAGIHFYNDSKSTVPEATIRAFEALCERYQPSQIHLIAGGYDKGSDLAAIANLTNHIAGLYAIGSTAKALCQGGVRNAIESKDLSTAVEAAFERAKSGDVILLSPGCASWDQFANYEQRGNLFETVARSCQERSSC